MQIGVLGTGDVGQAIGRALVEAGHTVMLGARDANNPAAAAWVAAVGGDASAGDFEAAARFGEVVFNCTSGQHSLAALQLAGDAALHGKVLVDVANPLDFSAGFPPSLTVCNTDSLAEQIQRAFPSAHVVKALNTVANAVMVAPGAVAGGAHVLPICGNDAAAKATVARILREDLGWSELIDLGDLSAARGMEAWLLLWVRLYGALGTGNFNIAIVR